MLFFFFSSRRRHTRYWRDWSSDVCSSDLVAARRGRLVESAIELGCPEGLAAEHVDRVLHEQRRRIQKAEDPDPIVLEALERSLRGEPTRRSRRAPWVLAGVVAIGVGVAVAVTYEPPTRPVPSLFGYDQER